MKIFKLSNIFVVSIIYLFIGKMLTLILLYCLLIGTAIYINSYVFPLFIIGARGRMLECKADCQDSIIIIIIGIIAEISKHKVKIIIIL